jgi:hypothetical protein
MGARENCSHSDLLPDIRGSHKSLSCSQLMSTQSQRRRQGRPPSHPPSCCQAQSQTRDRAVTAGALSHGTTAAHRCRLTACARTSPPARSIWPRWRASEHNSAGGWLQTRIAKQVRATLGDAPEGWLCHARRRATRTPFHVLEASPARDSRTCTQSESTVIRANQRSSKVINGHPSQSTVIRANQWSSVAIVN